MVWTLILTVTSILGGAMATYLYDEEAPTAARLCSGACIGMAVLGLVGFALASILGFGPVALLTAGLVVALPFLLLFDGIYRGAALTDIVAACRSARAAVLGPTRRAAAHFAFYALVLSLLWAVFNRVLFDKPDGLYTGVSNDYGDLPFHLGIITRFVYGGNLPPEDPTFAGARFTYPFLADFIVAMFVRAGAGLRWALLTMNFVVAVGFVGVLHRWCLRLSRDRLASMVAVLLVLLSGGLGWLLLFKEARQTETGIVGVLMNLPHDYTTYLEGGFRWGNTLTSLLIPQRSILLGLPLAIIIFTQWWEVLGGERDQGGEGAEGGLRDGGTARVRDPGAERVDAGRVQTPSRPRRGKHGSRRMMATGALAGALPLVHAHTFAVVMGLGVCLALISPRFRSRSHLFFGPALLIAAPQLYWVTRDSAVRPGSFLEWRAGWDRGDAGVFWFWLKNTGLLIPLALSAILWRGKKPLVCRRLLMFYLPFVLCFVAGNLFKFAPWIWDNIKIMVYWYMASAVLVGLVIARLWRGGPARRAAAVVLVVSLTMAGAMDIWRIVSGTSELREFDSRQIAFADVITRTTPPQALILHAPIHNDPIVLTGRRSLMGYPGHVWTHGIQYGPREADIKQMYAGGPDAEALMKRYGIDYVIVSPVERAAMPVSEQFFKKFPKVGEEGDQSLYRVGDR